jgi:hypothetical protein
MNMVFHATDDDGLTIVISQDTAEVTVQFFTE